MGQKRIHNIIDEKFGTHLAEFQKKLTNSMEEAYFERIDELNRRTEELNNRADAFANALDRGEELTKKNHCCPVKGKAILQPSVLGSI